MADQRFDLTPLHYSAWKRNSTAFQVLVEGGARTGAVDHDGATPAGMVRETPELHGLLPLLAAPR